MFEITFAIGFVVDMKKQVCFSLISFPRHQLNAMLRCVRCMAFVSCLSSLICNASKILVIPGNVNSHGLYFTMLAAGLAERGHRVHVVAPANGKVLRHMSSENLTIRVYEVDGQTPFANSAEASAALTKYALTESTLERFQIAYTFGQKLLAAWEKDCSRLLQNEAITEEIRNGGFQFAIMDPLSINCYYVIPYSLGIPFASMSIPFAGWLFGIPRLPSFVSTFGDSDEMPFVQRLLTFVTDIVQVGLLNRTKVYSEKYAPHKPPLDALQLYEKSSLFLYMEDLSVGYPRPHMPNSVAVGDIMAQPAKPLQKDLQTFLDESSGGALIVSFGSYFDHIPGSVVTKFCQAFRRTDYRVVWKLKNAEFCSGSSNVMTMPWIPQNDLLAHENVRLLVTHGGLNSLIEAVYHSKPVIVFPVTLDQPGNAMVAESKGYGIQMKLSHFTAEELEENIRRIFTEKKFADNAKFASAILRYKQESPAERVSFMVDHVIKYGDFHLQSGALKLSTFQFIMFDIYLFFTGLILVICLVFGLIVCGAYKGCRKCLFGRIKLKRA